MSAPHETTDRWDRHWSEYEKSATLNPAQAYRRRLVFDALEIERARGPVRVLEIGCGQGDFSRELKERYPELELLGVDLSDVGVEMARTKVPTGVFHKVDLTTSVALPDRYRRWATHAVCSEVLEHTDDPSVVLQNVRALLAPGARLVVTVPAGPMSAFDRHIGHRGHFTFDRLRRLLGGAGFELASVHGAGFPFFNLYRLLVVARGRKLIVDASSERELPASARAAMRAFSWLFRFNVEKGRLGWQMVAVAVEPT
jgi:SAM-dependent methyltransferase